MSNQQSKRGRYNYDNIETETPSKKPKYGKDSTGVAPWKKQMSAYVFPAPNPPEQLSNNIQSVYSVDTINSQPVTPTATPRKASHYHERDNSGSGDIPFAFPVWGNSPSMISPKAAINEFSGPGTCPFSHDNFTPLNSETHMSVDMIPRLQTGQQDPSYLTPFYQTYPMPQAPLIIPFSVPASEFDYFSPCESPESMVFQSPTTLSSPAEMYFRNAGMPPDFSAIPSMAATHDYYTQDMSSHCLSTRVLGPVGWYLGLDYHSQPSSASSHVCLSQVSAILGRLKQRRRMMGQNPPPAGPQQQQQQQQQQNSKTEEGAFLQDTITMSRESTEQITRVLNCGCLSKDATLTRFIIAAIFELINDYSSVARGIVGDHARAEGRVRARVGMILGELPGTSHLLDLLAGRWYQAHYHASDPIPMMTAQDMLSKQEEASSPYSLSPLSFSEIESKLRQHLQAATREIMRYCGRA